MTAYPELTVLHNHGSTILKNAVIKYDTAHGTVAGVEANWPMYGRRPRAVTEKIGETWQASITRYVVDCCYL